MADLLAFVCDVYCDFVTFPFGILGQLWYLIVSTLKQRKSYVKTSDLRTNSNLSHWVGVAA